MNPWKQDFKGSWDQETMSPRFQQELSPRFQNFLKSGHQELLRSREHDVKRSRSHEFKISARTDFQISRLHEARTSRTPEVMSSWSLELTSPRAHDFGTSGVLDFWRSRTQDCARFIQDSMTSGVHDFWRSRCQDINPYWFPGITISWWLEPKIYSFCFGVVLSPMSASGTGGSPLQIGRRTSGNGAWYSTRFLSPRNIICFGTQQAVFSVTRNRFRNRKQLARKGMENSSEVVVFYRAPRVPTPIFNWSGVFVGPQLSSASRKLIFETCCTQKTGRIL